MPVQRQNPYQSSFHRKLLAFEATWAQNLHRTHLGLNRFRVLTVTSTPERVQTLVAACRQLQRGEGLFQFTDAETYQSVVARHAGRNNCSYDAPARFAAD